jgi:hypothetical protein
VSTPTTRRHPRSLAEAFPRDHANPIHWYPSPARRMVRALICIAAAAAIGVLVALGA